MNLHDELVGMSACKEAVKWVGGKSLATAWASCDRADWMLWYAYRRGVDPRILTRAACACARTALQYVPTAEDRPRLAIEAVEAWADDPTECNRSAADSAAADSAAAAESAEAAAAWSARAAARSAQSAARSAQSEVESEAAWAAESAWAAAAWAAAAAAESARAAAAWAAAAAAESARAAAWSAQSEVESAWAAARSARAAAHRDMANLVRGLITVKMLDAPR